MSFPRNYPDSPKYKSHLTYKTLLGEWTVWTPVDPSHPNNKIENNFPIAFDFVPFATMCTDSFIVFLQTVTMSRNKYATQYPDDYLHNTGFYAKFSVGGKSGKITIQDSRPSNLKPHPSVKILDTTMIFDKEISSKSLTPFYFDTIKFKTLTDEKASKHKLYRYVSSVSKQLPNMIGNKHNDFHAKMQDCPTLFTFLFQTDFKNLPDLEKQYDMKHKTLSDSQSKFIMNTLEKHTYSKLFETYAIEITPDSKLRFLSKFSWFLVYTHDRLQHAVFSVSSEISETTKILLEKWNNTGFTVRDFVYPLELLDNSYLETNKNFIDYFADKDTLFYPNMDALKL